METPSVIYYEHQFDDSLEKSLAKSVLNLGNECRALAEENARLKAEVERLRASSFVTAVPVEQYERLRKAGDALADEIIGCYRGEGYDPADSETLPKWNEAKEGKPSV